MGYIGALGKVTLVLFLWHFLFLQERMMSSSYVVKSRYIMLSRAIFLLLLYMVAYE